MAGKQVIGKKTILVDPTLQLKEISIIIDSEEEKDNNSLPESAVDNNHSLSNQPMLPPEVSNKISSPLTDISKANTSLPLIFQNSKDEKDLLTSPNPL